MCDIVIIGSGPSGLSAALALGRARKRVLLCDVGPRRNAAAMHMHNFVTRDGTAVELADGTSVSCDALFVHPPERQGALVNSLGLAVEDGYLKVDPRTGETSRPGITRAAISPPACRAPSSRPPPACRPLRR